MTKLIIADDHKLIRDGIRAMLEDSEKDFYVTGEAASGEELIEMLGKSDAEVILMDINMPGMNGLEATHYITQHFPHIKVLVLSMMEQEKCVADALKAGALGYILKTAGQQELIHSIQAVAHGQQYISSQIAMNILKTIPYPLPFTVSYTGLAQTLTSDLSKREIEVLHFISEGYTNAEIADKLFTSKRTVESHRHNLLQKTGCKNTASLILYASKHRLIS